MAHKAERKVFQGKEYTHHVIYAGCAVMGFKDEQSAQRDADDRNKRAKKLGTPPNYRVEPVDQAQYMD